MFNIIKDSQLKFTYSSLEFVLFRLGKLLKAYSDLDLDPKMPISKLS